MKFFCLLLIVKFAFFDELSDSEKSSIMQDMDKCEEASQNIDKCTSIELSNNNYQCCVLEINYESDDSNDISCEFTRESFDTMKNIIEDPKTKAMMNEMNGFFRYGFGFNEEETNYSFNQTYTCKDGSVKTSYNFEYTKNEEKILSSKTHCLSYYFRYMDFENIVYDEEKDIFSLKPVSSKECFNADLLQSSKDAGISCGYYEFKIKYEDGNSENFTTCFLVNPNFYKNGNFDFKTKSQFESFIFEFFADEENAIQNYIVQFSDSEGNSYIYDSSIGKIELSEPFFNDNDSSSYINLNVIILFIFLFL